MLLVVVCAAVAVPREARASGAAGTDLVRLKRVEFDDSSGRASVSLVLSAPVRFSVTRLSSPDRVAVDLAATDVSEAAGTVPCNHPIVSRVRVGQFSPEVGRVVLDLTRPAYCSAFSTPDDPSVVTIQFNYVVSGVSFELRDGAPGFRIDGTGPMASVSGLIPGPERIVVDIPGATLIADAGVCEVEHPLVSRVRAAQFTPTTVRVVCDLKKRCSFTTQTEPGQGKAPGSVRVRLLNMMREAAARVEPGRTRLWVAWDRPSPVSLEFSPERKEIVLTAEDCDLDADFAAALDPSKPRDGSPEAGLPQGIIRAVTAERAAAGTVRLAVTIATYSQRVEATGEATGMCLDVYDSVLSGKKIVIDPGHGGIDPGAVGYSGLLEKSVNLEIARSLAGDLADGGATVVMTRCDDTQVFLPDRLRTCAQVGADAFVSIHSNAYSDSYPSGTETFYYGQGSESERLARLIHAQVVSEIRLPDRKAKERDFYVLREAKSPAALIEVAFISNVAEEVLLMDTRFRNRVARAIYRGLVAYFTPADFFSRGSGQPAAVTGPSGGQVELYP